MYINHGSFDNKKFGVYGIYNILTGKVYIGSTVKFHRRSIDHTYYLKSGIHHSILLQRSFGKYGFDAFEFLVLEYVSDKYELLTREQYWMDLTDASNPKFGYNISPTAGNCLGVKQSDEARQKKSAALIGITRSVETRAKIAAANCGPKHSDETKAKIGKASKGRIISAATRAKIGLKSRGRKLSEESKAKISAAAKKRGISWNTRLALMESQLRRSNNV